MKPLSIAIEGLTLAYRQRKSVNLAELPAGVYAVDGPNGAGKTTFLESLLPLPFFQLSPYYGVGLRQMVLSGAQGQIDLAVEIDGERHRVVVDCDPQANGGKGRVEARWITPAGQVHGPALGAFAEQRDRFLPSYKVTIASVFAPQQGLGGESGRFFSLDRAARRAIFAEQLGAEHYAERAKAFGEAAKAAALGHQALAALARQATDEGLAAAATEVQRAREAEGEARTKREAAAVELQRAQEAAAGAQAALGSAASRESREDVESRLRRMRGDLPALTAAVTAVPNASEKAALTQKLTAAEACVAESLATQDALRSSIVEAEKEVARFQAVAQLARRDVAAGDQAQASLAGVNLELDICAQCPLTADARAATERAAVAGPQACDAAIEQSAAELRLSEYRLHLAAQQGHTDSSRAQVASLRRRLDQCTQAIADEENRARDRAALEARIEAAEALLASCPPADAVERRDRAARELDGAKQRFAAIDLEHATSRHTLGIRNAELDRYQELVTAARRAAQEAEPLATKVADCTWLARAFGANGIPALLIDAAGPTVTSIANELLDAGFGSRFSIALETLRPKAAGGFQEVFDVRLIDSRAGSAHAGSGGEMVLVDEALRLAIALSQSDKRVAFLARDETAGALSDDLAPRYVDMLRTARRIGGFDLCFFVSHKPSLVEAADGRISCLPDQIEVSL